jgi:DNA helicase-2/ATP-dependent DNA helicase PcrA
VKLHDGIGNATADALWKSFKGELAAGVPPHKAVRALVLDPALDGTIGRRAKPGVEKYARLLSRLGDDDVKDKPAEQIRVLLDDHYADFLRKSYPVADERIAEIDQLADYAAGFADTEAFLSELMLVQSFSAEEIVSAEDPDERVCLSSVHQAKGLEWSHVFCLWMADGTFPSDLALKEDLGEDEERRLYYVAVTRAKNELYLTYPQTSRMRDTQVVLHKPSRFITELPAPQTDDDGSLIGLYEPWVLELVPPEQLPPSPTEHAPRLGPGGDATDDDGDDGDTDEALERYRMEN